MKKIWGKMQAEGGSKFSAPIPYCPHTKLNRTACNQINGCISMINCFRGYPYLSAWGFRFFPQKIFEKGASWTPLSDEKNHDPPSG